ncbi:transposase [Paenibacillus xerothermodurans]|uniref:transposase n=1 Tax=Paenibacillus xerothermodurans TaxID=1977292 RepID=UPI001401CC51|nr:transposase [Paenibacillus xerothermodurans]
MKRIKYDKAFKVEAVLQVLGERRKVSHVAKSLGIIPTMLSRWVYEYEQYGDKAFTGNGVPVPNTELEIQRLQKRDELQLENEILKKFQEYSKRWEKLNTLSSEKAPRTTP